MNASNGPYVSSLPTMILLRYGIRCSLHYSVPLTLGLIAYTGSWQGVARNLMSETKAGGKPEPADAKSTEVAASKDGTSKSTTGSTTQDRPEGESLAMNPDRGDAPRSLTIPKADSSRIRDTVPESSPDGSSRSRIDPNRPPRDRDIDATGHQAMIAQSEPNRSGPPLSAGMAAGAAGLAFVAVNPQNVATEQVAASATRPDTANETPSSPVSSQSAHIAGVSAHESGANPSLTAQSGNPPVSQAAQPEPNVPHPSSAEPARLNPQIRAIAAEVPSAVAIAQSESPESPKPPETPEKQIASHDSTNAKPAQEIHQAPAASDANVATPAAVAEIAPKARENEPPVAPEIVAKAEPKTQSVMPPPVDRKKAEIPDVVIAQKGETWNRIAERIYGDEKMAETIWRENRDAHGGSSDAMPIAGRMVRLPEIGKSDSIPNSGQTQLARTAR